VSQVQGRRCEACGTELSDRQRWCLGCGSATLTPIAPSPAWRLAAASAAVFGLLALVGVGYAVSTLLAS
jgi:hypothetical protein